MRVNPRRISAILALLTLVISISRTQPPEGRPSASLRTLDAGVERRVDSLLNLMTLEEKCGQLNQRVGVGGKLPERVGAEQAEEIRRGLIGSFLGVVGAVETRRVQRIAVEESRLHIPLLFGLDVIHGYRTTFPIPLAEASTWNPDLVEQAARTAALEATASGIHWTFAPMVDIARDPRWGRIAEGSGEDPFLGSVMAAARVRGFQGKGLGDETSLLACVKHFAAYGGAEAGRDYNVVDLSERTLREIYLPPYKAAVDAGVGTVMTAFNEIGGVPSTASKWLFTDILRNEWGFKGFVVSDWEAIQQLMDHGVAATRADAGTLALNAGVDMDMMSGIYRNELVDAVKQGKVPESVVDRSVRNLLRVKFALGVFENPYRGSGVEREKAVHLAAAHRELARKVAQQSVVLLKNAKHILPLKKSVRTIAVIGPLADNKKELPGSWAAEGKWEEAVSLLEGIRKKTLRKTRVLYARGCSIRGDSGLAIEAAVRTAVRADVVIVAVGEEAGMSGEAASRSEIDLPGRQLQLVKAIQVTRKPMVLVLMNGRPLAIPWEAEHVGAIVEAWFPGLEAGNAIADVLFGDVAPSGKLPVTFPRNVGQVPIYYNFKNTGRPGKADDKYTSKYIDVSNTPLYPFGYGLSYTTFSYSGLTVNPPAIDRSGSITATVVITNTGRRKGEEVVQWYIQDVVASVTRPVKELKGFQRVALEPGEKKTVTFTIKAEDLSFYGPDMKPVVEPGLFKIYVGGNSVDVLEGKFELK